jgi:hypothetical protein
MCKITHFCGLDSHENCDVSVRFLLLAVVVFLSGWLYALPIAECSSIELATCAAFPV